MKHNNIISLIVFLIIFLAPGYIAEKYWDADILTVSLVFWSSLIIIVTIYLIKKKWMSSKIQTNNILLGETAEKHLLQTHISINSIESKECPLNNAQVKNIINTLNSKNSLYDFDTFDFIHNCIIGEKDCNARINAGNKIPCGKRLGKYRTETKLIFDQSLNSGSRGRKWIKNKKSYLEKNHLKVTTNIISASQHNNMLIPPITQGHKRALKWYESENFRTIKTNYDIAFGYNNVYFRVVDSGVTAISLDVDCPSFLGINPNRKNKMCYINTGSIAKHKNDYYDLKANFNEYKKTIRRHSIEEKTVIKFIKHSLDNNLSLMKLPKGYYFLNNEWRFLDFNQGGRKSDVLGININNNSLVIIEFKSNSDKRNEAIKQAKEYSSFYCNYQKEYDIFFKSQFHALNKLYNNDSYYYKQIRFNTKPELFFGYPENNDIILEEI